MARLESLRAAVLAMLAMAPACSDPTTHILVGNAFDPAGMCLEPSVGFDVVYGPQPAGECPPTCVVDARTGTTYVTVTCPPYPPLDTTELPDATTGSNDPCVPALSAWAAEAACGLDAGLPDAGTAADAAKDAQDAALDRAARDAATDGGAG